MQDTSSVLFPTLSFSTLKNQSPPTAMLFSKPKEVTLYKWEERSMADFDETEFTDDPRSQVETKVNYK